MRSTTIVASRACDCCKQRKVKCDSTEPCAPCRISNRTCHYTVIQKKRGPKRRRVDNECPSPSADGAQGLQTPPATAVSPQLPDSPASECLISLPSSTTPDFRTSGSCRLPVSNFIAAPETSPAIGSTTSAAQAIWHDLILSLEAAQPSFPALEIVEHYIDLHMQYVFPTALIVHESTIRTNASLLFSGPSPTALFSAPNEHQKVAEMRYFTLVTALCASTASVMPESLLSYGHDVAGIFLHSSREMLKTYEDYDLEHPDSSSVVIRDFHSVALQHVTGKKGAADQVLGQACLIALSLRLYDETAIARNDPVETQLLRFAFWHLYSADKAAATMEDRPYVLHDSLFRGGLTLHSCGELPVGLLDESRPWYDRSFEDRLLIGYRFIPRLWSSAASLISDVESRGKITEDTQVRTARLTQAYLDFSAIMDDLPQWLRIPGIMVSPEDGEGVSFQKKAFWVQRCTIFMTFRCLKLLILQRCIENRLWNVIGLSDHPLAVAMKKAEVIQDFLQTMDDIPFVYHQIKGEPNVERIRPVGALLLQMIETVDDEAIQMRLRSYFTRLLDSLARLNSKISVDAE